jgi:aryl-alcohol dehydrogenase-like predicted oxidoreductase
MRTRKLGSSDLEVSVVGLGCNNFGRQIDEVETKAVVDAAIDSGITFFDTADVYGAEVGLSETFLGNAIKGRRDSVLLATKWGGIPPVDDGRPDARGTREFIRASLESSLRRLGTEYVDLYQYHRPDGITPIGETLSALEELVQEGKIRYAGSSNFDSALVEEADEVSRTRGIVRFVSAQNQYSLAVRDAEAMLLPTCERLGIGVLPFFPLTSGLLTGKYVRGEPYPEGTRLAAWSGRLQITDEQWDRAEAIFAFAAGRGLEPLEVAIGGLAAMPAIGSVIAGATSPEQVRMNAAAGDWVPSAGELEELKAL